jgi:hypothetical protein
VHSQGYDALTADILILVLQLVFLAAIAAAVLLAKKYLPSYLAEKGKNLATKEDIRDITDRIEGVKARYATELEEIKAVLAAQNQQRLRVFEKRTDALIQFFEDGHTVLSKRQDPLGFRYDDIADLDEYIRSTLERITQVQTSFHRVLVYLPPGDLVKAAGDVVSRVLNLRPDWQRLIWAYRRAAEKEIEGMRQGIINPNLTAAAVRDLQRFLVPEQQKLEESLRAYVDALNRVLLSPDGKQFLSLASAITFGPKESED